MRRMLLVCGLLLALFCVALPAGAQEPVGTPPGLIGPPETLPPPSGLHVAYQRVDVTINEQVAVTRIDQLFVNENDWMVEGTYLFPLPVGAAVSELTMWVDGEPVEAKMLTAGEARAIYDEIVRQWRDPALLEYVGQDVIQANVFPIPPNAERRIELEYSQVLPAENGLIRYIFPQSTDLYTNLPLDVQSISVEVLSNEAIRTIYSPSHSVAIDRPTEFRALAGFEAAGVLPDRDFELYYSVTPDDIGLNLLSYKEDGQDGFFLLMVAPGIEVDPTSIVAKDVILVLDTSGSMQGAKLMQAKEAARFIVESLNPEDQFNIVTFSTGTRSYDTGLVSASEPGDYAGFVNSLEPVGGTNISQALLEAVNFVGDSRPTTILFLTDGLATEGIVETPLLLSTVEEVTPSNTRLFAFGVGDDVDTFLLDSLTQAHRGTTTYVRPGQPIDEAVSGFYAKINTPVLADIALDFGDLTVEQLYPVELPDLFAGTQLVIAGRYREGGETTITLSGDVNGEPQSFAYPDQLFRSSGGDAFIPRLWATRAIGHLLTQIRLHGEDAELVQSIVNLSIRYGIITPYTSYLIEEDDIFTQTGRQGIVEDASEELSAPAPVSGAEAVEAAAAQSNLADAESPLAPVAIPSQSGDPQEAIRIVNSRTFVYRDGVWIDTAFDPEQYVPQRIGFAGDSYFDLLALAPELGPVFALGERVLVVYGDSAYEIVPGEGDTGVELPDPGEVSEPSTTNANEEPPTTPPASNQADSGEQNLSSTGICTAAMILPVILGMLGAGSRQWSRRKRSLR